MTSQAVFPVRSAIVLTRVFDGPPDLVFRVWTDPKLVALWWGVEGASNPICELDVRPGGRWRIDMRTTSGRTYRNEGVYLEVVENKRLVYSDIPDPEISEWQGRPPAPRLHTVTFTEHDNRTHVSLEVTMATDADRDRMIAFGMSDGLKQGFDRLARLLVSLQIRPSEAPDSNSSRATEPDIRAEQQHSTGVELTQL